MDYLAWPDYLILVVFLVISLGIGVYHSLTGGRQKTTTDFIMANRSLKVLPTALSLCATFQSAIKILGLTAEMYSYGSQLLIVMLLLSSTLGFVLTMQVAVPWMYPLKLVSINEYLELRFKSKLVRILASMSSILMAVMSMGVTMYAPSAALEAVTGLRIAVTIPVMSAVTVAYTAMGGMRAVIWTDVFQGLVMIGGMIAILIKGLVVVGGFSNVFEFCAQSGRLNWIDWSPDPTVRHTVWGFLLGLNVNMFCVFGFSQSSAQRYMATKTLSQAKLSVGLNAPLYFLITCTACLTGLVVVSYYTSIGCDPLSSGDIRNANQLLPHFVLKMFSDSPGFAGLFLATLYGGALSTVSSSLSGSAANCWEDILQWKLKHWTESRKVLLNRFLVVVFGVAACGLSFVVSATPGPLFQIVIAFSSAVLGPNAGLFLLGGLNRRANAKGALIGGITSLAGSLWLTFGSIMMKQRHPTLPPLSTDGCTMTNNLTYSNYKNTNFSSIKQFFDESPINATMTYFHLVTNKTNGIPLHGSDKFYSISYVWYSLLWALVTIVVGTAASFLCKESSVDDVDEKLLINVRTCFKWRSDSKSDITTKRLSNGEIGTEATGVMMELAEPCPLPTNNQKSSTTIPLHRTNEQKNAESKTHTDVEYPT